jgi:hypothetical protein
VPAARRALARLAPINLPIGPKPSVSRCTGAAPNSRSAEPLLTGDCLASNELQAIYLTFQIPEIQAQLQGRREVVPGSDKTAFQEINHAQTLVNLRQHHPVAQP